MSIIQKLENSYVAILRVVIIIFATILLIGAVGLVVMSLVEKFGSAPAGKTIKVDTSKVLTAVVPAAEAPAAASEAAKGRAYQAEFDKAYALVTPFVQKHSAGKETLDKEVLFATLDGAMERFDEPAMQKAYITGWNETMSASLKDKRILERAAAINAPAPAAQPVAQAPAVQAESEEVAVDGETSEEVTDDAAAAAAAAAEEMSEEVEASGDTAEGIVTEISNAYSEQFSTQYMENLLKPDTEGSAKMGSMTYMIAAASIFFSFLCVIFLTVTIRIERNLREIAYRPVAEIRPAAM